MWCVNADRKPIRESDLQPSHDHKQQYYSKLDRHIIYHRKDLRLTRRVYYRHWHYFELDRHIIYREELFRLARRVYHRHHFLGLDQPFNHV